ncbi:hypothetical protein KUTeg_002130 [Tegillarca granosa]|uniref:Chordin n=1 Tax=Tegillarca granosa TaxID=220873 RepID=A0ABQ9FTF9_TEGGR|nr:hypothetical protein KUTeg_002130 [Tegillarca granosa]
MFSLEELQADFFRFLRNQPGENLVTNLVIKKNIIQQYVETFEDRFSLLPETLPKELNAPTNSDRLTNRYTKPREYTAVLAGRKVPSRESVFTRGVALVRLKVTRTSGLQFYVKYTHLTRPRYIRITDTNGNVLLEKSLLNSARPDNTFCGEWHKVPFYYLRYLNQGRLLVTITTVSYPNGEVSGVPEINRKHFHGTFGALLVSPTADGIGAYAELTYNIRSKSLNYVITYNGLFADKLSKRRRQEYFVTIERRTKIVHEASKRSKLRKNKLKGLWRKMDKKSRRLIARNRLRMRAVLSNAESRITTVRPVSSIGSAVFFLQQNGNIRLMGMKSPVTSITMETTSHGRKGKRKVVGNIIKNFQRNITSFDGIAQGVLTKPNAKEIALLLSGKLFINVATADSPISLLRGRIDTLPYNEILHPFTDNPFLLMSPEYAPTGVAGHAWLATDENCALHYLIALSGLKEYNTITALLSGKYSSSNNDIYTIIISNFVHGKADGVITDLSQEVFLNLASGIAVLHIEVKGIAKGEVQTTLTIPNKCWQMVGDQEPGVIVDEDGNVITTEKKNICKYEGSLYNDGESWIPKGNFSCSTCSCKQGNIICHRVICPKLQCSNTQIKSGECCPVCADTENSKPNPIYIINQNNTSQLDHDPGCYYEGDKRYYKIGTSWHPYVPPFGYSKCAICTCTHLKQVNCSRLPCPKLTCLHYKAVRLNISDCCPVCPHTNIESKPPQNSREQADMNMEGVCRVGEQVFANGSRWTPDVKPFGKMRIQWLNVKRKGVEVVVASLIEEIVVVHSVRVLKDRVKGDGDESKFHSNPFLLLFM